MRKPTPIGELSALSADRKTTLIQWREGLSLRALAQKVAQEWSIHTDKDQLKRWFKRYKLEAHVDDASDDQLAVGQLLDAEALGNVEYRPAALKLVEKRAFELALESDTKPSDLKDLFGIFYRADQAESDRQRIEVAKERNRIARENLELKKLRLQVEVELKTSREEAASSRQHSARNGGEDQLGSALKPGETDSQYTERMTKIFRKDPLLRQLLPDEELTETPVDQSAVARTSFAHPVGPASSTTVSVPPSNNVGDEVTSLTIPDRDSTSLNHNRNHNLNLDPSTLPTTAETPLHDCDELNSESDSELPLHEDGEPETEISRKLRKEAAARETLLIAVYNYTMRRCDEYDTWRAGDRAERYFSKLKECPCGEASPCPRHGEMPTFFWKNSPWSILYGRALADYGLPFHPMLLPDGPPGETYSDPSRWRDE